MTSLLRTNKEIAEIYDRQIDTVYRVCYSFMKNKPETEDMVQETFLRLITSEKAFENIRHERAWLIVTASNLCRDSLKHWWRRGESLDDNPALAAQAAPERSPVMDAILQLPRDYKDIVYMYYYEGYTTQEIAHALGCPPSTVRSRLLRARQRLKSMLGGEPND
ncbi:MAG: RNA polymerase sigma factor [Eubacteriales bacterium]|nr:RNA polymerase sigma factor [Eubacteriales bacterium]